MPELQGDEPLLILKQSFLDHLRVEGFISRAAPFANRSERQVRRWIAADAEFAARVEEAREIYWASVRQKGLDRAINGVTSERRVGDRVVEHKTIYSDNLMKFFLERYDPMIADKPERIVHEHTNAEAEDEIDFSRFESDEEIELFLALSRKAHGQPEEDESEENA